MKVYKVVRNINGKLVSAFLNHYDFGYLNESIEKEFVKKFELTYKKGIKTVPLKGKIFAFKDLNSAINFNIGDEIWEAEAVVTRKKYNLLFTCLDDIINNFDKYWECACEGYEWYYNTVLCSSLTLIKKVKEI